jgi:hypothetical protein
MFGYSISEVTFFILYNVGNFFAFVAFWPRTILHLRVYMAVSMLFLSLYFFFVSFGPVWNALFWMVPTFVINIWMIWVILREQKDYGIPHDMRAFFESIRVLTPGQFKKLLSAADRTTGPNQALIKAGEPTDQLHYLLKGSAHIAKGEARYRLKAGSFLGEIAFLQNVPATATVHLEQESECLTWDSQKLRQLMERDSAIDIAMRGLFNRDLAAKLAPSMPIMAEG